MCPWVTLLISFRNFSSQFTTWLTVLCQRPTFQPVWAFHMPFSLSLIISSLVFKLRDMWLPFTWTLRGRCRVIINNWPNFNIASQGTGRPKERERQKDSPQGKQPDYTHIKFAVLCRSGSLCLKTIIIVTSKVTDHRDFHGSSEVKTLASTAGVAGVPVGELGSHISHHAKQPKSEKKKKKLKHSKTRCT